MEETLRSGSRESKRNKKKRRENQTKNGGEEEIKLGGNSIESRETNAEGSIKNNTNVSVPTV